MDYQNVILRAFQTAGAEASARADSKQKGVQALEAHLAQVILPEWETLKEKVEERHPELELNYTTSTPSKPDTNEVKIVTFYVAHKSPPKKKTAIGSLHLSRWDYSDGKPALVFYGGKEQRRVIKTQGGAIISDDLGGMLTKSVWLSISAFLKPKKRGRPKKECFVAVSQRKTNANIEACMGQFLLAFRHAVRNLNKANKNQFVLTIQRVTNPKTKWYGLYCDEGRHYTVEVTPQKDGRNGREIMTVAATQHGLRFMGFPRFSAEEVGASFPHLIDKVTTSGNGTQLHNGLIWNEALTNFMIATGNELHKILSREFKPVKNRPLEFKAA